MVKILREPDEAVEQVGGMLEEYEDENPGSECLVYRYNPASIRVKIVDSSFMDAPREIGTTMRGDSCSVCPRTFCRRSRCCSASITVSLRFSTQNSRNRPT